MNDPAIQISEAIPAHSALTATRGMVTANHILAAQAGAQILARGGNAIDAAIATSLALGVVEPAMSGLGGRGYLVIHSRRTGAATAIDANSRAPAAARPDMFAVDDTVARERPGWGRLIPAVGDANAIGHRAVAAPSLAGALSAAHHLYATLPLDTLFAPAIELAEDGFDVSVAFASCIALAREKLARFPATAEIFLREDGTPLRAGDRLVQQDLARTLRAVASRGFAELFTGTVALAIVEEVGRGDGVLSASDIADPGSRVWERPLIGSYRGHRILGIPEMTGNLTLVQIMNLLEGFDLGALHPWGSDVLHLLLDACRIAFTDRAANVDDPAFGPVPFAGLASKEFADLRRAAMSRAHALRDVTTADPWPFEPSALESPVTRASDAVGSDTHTSHLCVVDRDGTVVSMTQSIIDSFGSGVVVPGTGVLLNSAMHNFVPMAGRRGSIAPGKRSAHFGCPTILVGPHDGTTIAIGGGGGTKIVTGIAGILLAVVDQGRGLQEAIELPRVHNEGSRSQVDERLGQRTRLELEAMGHDNEVVRSEFGDPAFARINAIQVLNASGTASSGVDPYSDAGAAAPA